MSSTSALALSAVLVAAVAGYPVLAQSGGKGEVVVNRAPGVVHDPAVAAAARGGIPITSAERVSIRVPEYPVLSGEYRINDDETISFPVVGRVKVSGKTAAELELEIADEVRRRAGRECQVTMEVIEYKPVFVNGYVTRAGAMPWKPGYTVMHAESLAGGVFRPSDNRSALPAESERARANRAAADLARVLAQHARIQAERAGEAKVPMPKEMLELVSKAEATKLMEAQNSMHQSRRVAFDARIKSLHRGRSVAEEEVRGLKDQMARLDEQITLRQTYSKSVKALNAKGLVRFERTLDEQTRVSELEERRTNVIVALARVHGTLASVVRELDVAQQERVAQLDEELIRLEREAAQQRIEVDAAKIAYRRLTGQNALAGTDQRANPILSYEIVRTEFGTLRNINAQPLTPLLPGDLLVVRLQEQPSQ
ncbi:MAG: polysaccharide biosynthesis/export family protein [Hyphomicrobiaceae bacterium]|nr:polysaccharide biosynthesis/export family protein [Hyphomicrobiaceae bacterium]